MTKTVLITGCSTGLGKTTAERFASEGWNVVATMRRPESELVEKYPGTVLVETLDVTDPASVARAVATGEERFGGIDAVHRSSDDASAGRASENASSRPMATTAAAVSWGARSSPGPT